MNNLCKNTEQVKHNMCFSIVYDRVYFLDPGDYFLGPVDHWVYI